MNPAGTITIAPLYLENFACQIFLCLHAISIVLSFGRVFYDLGPVFVLSLLGGASVCSFPLAYSLRQHSLERQSLLSGLDTFEVREAWPASKSMFSIISIYKYKYTYIYLFIELYMHTLPRCIVRSSIQFVLVCLKLRVCFMSVS